MVRCRLLRGIFEWAALPALNAMRRPARDRIVPSLAVRVRLPTPRLQGGAWGYSKESLPGPNASKNL